MNFKTCLKLYSTDVALIPEAGKLFQDGLFSYVELYIMPASYQDTIDTWKGLDCPFVIHAPHSLHNVNLAQAEKRESNKRHFHETCQFADTLGSDIIIVHSGSNGSFDETIEQLAMLNDDRIALENKPKVSIYNDEICAGYSPAEFQRAADAGVLSGTALDFGHAVCAANSLNIDVGEIIQGFLKFDPKIFHISDGDASSEKDTHYNLGRGNMDIPMFLSAVPDGGLVTLETPRNPSTGLEDFIHDYNYLQKTLLKAG